MRRASFLDRHNLRAFGRRNRFPALEQARHLSFGSPESVSLKSRWDIPTGSAVMGRINAGALGRAPDCTFQVVRPAARNRVSMPFSSSRTRASRLITFMRRRASPKPSSKENRWDRLTVRPLSRASTALRLALGVGSSSPTPVAPTAGSLVAPTVGSLGYSNPGSWCLTPAGVRSRVPVFRSRYLISGPLVVSTNCCFHWDATSSRRDRRFSSSSWFSSGLICQASRYWLRYGIGIAWLSPLSIAKACCHRGHIKAEAHLWDGGRT